MSQQRTNNEWMKHRIRQQRYVAIMRTSLEQIE